MSKEYASQSTGSTTVLIKLLLLLKEHDFYKTCQLGTGIQVKGPTALKVTIVNRSYINNYRPFSLGAVKGHFKR